MRFTLSIGLLNGKILPADRKTAFIFDVVAASKADAAMNRWHSSQLVGNNYHIEHGSSGRKVVAFERKKYRRSDVPGDRSINASRRTRALT